MQKLRKLLYLLTPQERRRASLLLLMITIMALLDMIGVASILPFMAVLTNPSIIETNIFLNTMFHASSALGVENFQQFLFFLGIVVFITLIISLAFKALTTYVQIRFVHVREYSIGKRLVEGYLYQQYSWFLNRHSAELGKTILSEVSHVVGLGINPLMELVSKGMVAIAIIILLLLIDPKLALFVGFTIGGTYGLIFYFTRSYLIKIGNIRLKNNNLRFKSVSEAFGAAKEIKLGALEKIYIKRYSDSAIIYARNQAAASVVSLLPRFILEIIAFGGILLIILYLISKTGTFNNALPVLSLYVYAGYRLMPALQSIYSSSSQLTFVGASIDKLYDDIKSIKTVKSINEEEAIFVKKKITLRNIHYNYPNTSRSALKNLNLTIPVNTTIGLVGKTGSGKTTTVDIILGLLIPQKGTLEIDGKKISKKKIRAWQKTIGYVPQNIYLSDDTIAANIAFGIDPNDISLKAVIRASKIANLHEFVSDELPKKYQTIIGERGVRLSGGQRQRIGIARALYHNPKMLVFDEATSALDNQTEKAVMDAVNNLNKSITIILIAHRLSTVKKCDKIYILENGKIINQGTFKKLFKVDKNFRLNAQN
jgi:ABC-type multidrug transport system fused ATPase/permease subunit